uniref:Uncharacterized protein n=1 Tax=viral metagenome TaxID=1070528 RepID=A0A6M3JAF7_9ZZZZ
MANTTPSALALQHLKTHLETKSSTWGIREVYDYPAYLQPVPAGPCISLEASSFQLVWAAVAGNTRVFDWRTAILLTYYDLNIVPQNAYRETIETIGLIATFLVTQNEPNDYGNVLIDGAGFGPELVLIDAAPDRKLYGAQIRMVHTITVEVTKT